MISCPSCSADNSDGSRFCSACGAALSPEYAATVTAGFRVEGQKPRDESETSSLSGSSHHGQFLPGAKIADRYRIVSLVGKGGMGEVYRADDLKLGHTVALKFLPKKLAEDANRLEHFHSEVRLTRQISHPNVCRVYDIGEVDGQHFLSMEYVDGEDLRVLLRRIGRLPRDKGVQIAQQLCAGLAAAHEKGVLHRDLKPANIMLDGRGQVRITDFGLAKLAEDGKEGEIAGTPRYMAPEQLARGETTIQSDLYSLGLILYELFTGEAVHKGGTVRELLQAHEESGVSQPSNLVDDMDPVVERVILRCLEKEPHARPKSAHAVAGALPGGDPLAAALAAGETPSPEMVAAAGETSGLTPRVAALFLIGTLICLPVTCWLAGWTHDINRDGLPYEPAVLEVKAQEIVRDNLGYLDPPFDAVHGFTAHEGSLRFWYRQRSQFRFLVDSYFTEIGTISRVRPTFHLPPWQFSNELGVLMTPAGRLEYFRACPPWTAGAPTPSGNATNLPWSEWFPPETIGFSLIMDEFEATDSDASLTPIFDQIRTPPDAFDAVRVWKGVDPESGEEIYVQAAAYRGLPVYFEVFSISEFQDPSEPQSTAVAGEGLETRVVAWMETAVLLGLAVLAIFNLRSGRCDRRGAARVAAVMFWIGVAVWATQTRHLFPLPFEIPNAVIGLSQVMFRAGLFWGAYIAIEPLVRRIWPQILISWSRLLNGRLRDPLVGRDLLLGAASGVFQVLLIQVTLVMHGWIDQQHRLDTDLVILAGTSETLGAALARHLDGVVTAAYLLLLLLLLRILLRSERWAMAVWFVVVTAAVVQMTGAYVWWFGWLSTGFLVAVSLFVLVRLGLFASGVYQTVYLFLYLSPLTLNAEHWYFSHSMFAVVWIAAMAVYGFYTSLGGRPVFAAPGAAR